VHSSKIQSNDGSPVVLQENQKVQVRPLVTYGLLNNSPTETLSVYRWGRFKRTGGRGRKAARGHLNAGFHAVAVFPDKS